MTARTRDQYVLQILPEGLVLPEINHDCRFLTCFVGEKLDSSHDNRRHPYLIPT